MRPQPLRPGAPGPENGYWADHAKLLIESFRRLTGRTLVAASSPAEAARCLYEAPFAVVSHDFSSDPLFNYANRTALVLFETTWEYFIGMPSRLSAEAPNRGERERLLETVKRQGYIDGYRGVRISATGRRFLIEGATVWNLYDAVGCFRGQAACIERWRQKDAGCGESPPSDTVPGTP